MSPKDEAELAHLLRLVYRKQEAARIRCQGKTRYPTRGAAEMNGRYAKRHTGMVTYRCPVCGSWHRGNDLRTTTRHPYSRKMGRRQRVVVDED